jgi:hypothetical protein
MGDSNTSHSVELEDQTTLTKKSAAFFNCNSVQFGESPTFQRNIFMIGKVSQLSEENGKVRSRAFSELNLPPAPDGLLLGIIFDPEERDGMFLRKVKLSTI